MPVVGGYTLHLYCDSGLAQPYWDQAANERPNGHHGEPGEFTGPTKAACLRAARAAGWFITGERQNTVTCPRCAAEWNKPKRGDRASACDKRR